MTERLTMADDKNDVLTVYSQFLDTSGEHLTYAALSVYRNFSGELSQKEKLFFKRHLESCPECTARLNEVHEVEIEETNESKITIMPFSPAVIRYAAAAVVVMAVGIALLYGPLSTSTEESLHREQASDLSLADATADPESFVPDQTLENFLDRTVRSVAGVKLIVPGIGDTVAMPVTIRWEGNTTGSQYTVVIVNNKSDELWKEPTSSAEITIDKKLEPGLYYIKLQLNGKLVHVGKFFVVR